MANETLKERKAMNRTAKWMTLACVTALLTSARAHAECAILYDSLDGATSIAANNGIISGTMSFIPGVNNNAIAFDGATHVTFPAGQFAGSGGSVALWFRKATTDTSGGILQIGTLGHPNSVGIFYANTSDLVFETRNSAGTLTAISASGVLSQTDWTHVVATWNNSGTARDMWLFINGYYVTYGYAAGTYDHAASALQVGYTGYWEHGRGAIDELRYFDWPLSDSELYAEYVSSSNRHRCQPTAKPVSTGPVQVIGKHLYVNGRPFSVRGVGYQPTPIGSYPWSYSVYTDPAILARDILVLEAMNVNTIRTWGPPPDNMLLDALYYNAAQPMYAMIGFWVPTSGIDYADPATITHYENEFRNLVRQFQDHPAVLGWLIGNEVNLGLSGQTLADWYALANRLAEVAYVEEGPAYHPTILVNAVRDFGNVDNNSDDLSLNFVDMWGHNTYFGWDSHCYFEYYDRVSAKPLVFTEFGVDAWDSRANAPFPEIQAAFEVHQWRQIESGCTGGTVMAYSDEWWKDMAIDNPAAQDFGGYGTHYHPDGYSNEEWYGVVAVIDNGGAPDIVQPRQAYYDLAQEFAYTAGDYDRDGDVDLADYAAFQACIGADATDVCGIVFDIEVDDTIDALDYPPFASFLNGPNQPPARD